MGHKINSLFFRGTNKTTQERCRSEQQIWESKFPYSPFVLVYIPSFMRFTAKRAVAGFSSALWISEKMFFYG
jgi:hypothetical protein